jgi:hypothetical protein
MYLLTCCTSMYRVIQQQFRGADQQQLNTFHPNRRVTTEDPNGAVPQQPPEMETVVTTKRERDAMVH